MKLALITAGFKRVGAGIAARLAADGWALALHGRMSLEPEAALGDVLAAVGTTWHGFAADLGDGAAAQAIIARVADRFGMLPSLVVNNASLFAWDDPVSVTPAAMADHFAINTTAPVLIACALAAALPPEGRATVINILDQRIRQPNGDQLSYTLSKQALAAATETLARALAPKLRVNAVAPGLTLPTRDYTPEQMNRLSNIMPLGVLPTPADIADAVAYLAGATSTTGQTIFVDGGANLTSFARDFLFLET